MILSLETPVNRAGVKLYIVTLFFLNSPYGYN